MSGEVREEGPSSLTNLWINEVFPTLGSPIITTIGILVKLDISFSKHPQK